ncbi:MAG: hypothetical protein R3E02_00950 [Blastomonas sp.]
MYRPDFLTAATGDRLLERLAEALAPGHRIETGHGQPAIDGDQALIRRAATSDAATPSIRLWTNRRCLVTVRAMARLPGFDEAQRASAAHGWPVYVRQTGGTTVAHRPGILNLSWARRAGAGPARIEHCFEEPMRWIVHAAGRLGYELDVGAAPGSYCDGRHNLCHHGRKLAGTAAAIRLIHGQRVLFFHASITITGDPAQDVAAIARFERSLGLPGDYRPEQHVALADIQPGHDHAVMSR